MPPFSKTWAFPRIYLSANYFGNRYHHRRAHRYVVLRALKNKHFS
jgi:hypothetical protein